MEIFTLFLAFAALCCHVAANKQAMGYEIVSAYYVYKIEYMSGIAPDDRRLGYSCEKKTKGAMCNFGDFAESLLKGKGKAVRLQYAGTNIRMPGQIDADKISKIVPPKQLVDVKALSKKFESRKNNIPYAEVIEELTSVAEEASVAGHANKDDFTNAATFADKARDVRARASFVNVVAALRTAMGDASGMLQTRARSKTYDWEGTLKKINDAVSAGQMTADRAQELRKLLINAQSFTVPSNDPKDEGHWAIIRAYATFSTKVRDISARMAAGAPSVPATGGGDCDSEFVTR